MFVSNVLATFTITVSLPSKSLTENDQTTASVTVTNPASSTETIITVSLTSGTSWFTTVSSCGTISSLATSQSSTSTCIIKPTSTGTDLSLTATAQSSGGTTGSGTTSGITVNSQSTSLTASLSGDSSVALSSTFYVGITVTAPSIADITNVRATITESGACAVDTSYLSAGQNLGNVTKGTSKSGTSWKLTASSSSGTCSISINVVSDNGGTANPTASVTVGTPTSGGPTTAGSSGGSSGGAAAGAVIETKTISNISSGKTGSITLSKSNDFKIQEISIIPNKDVANVQITVKESSLPSGTSVPVASTQGLVLKYVEITKRNIDDTDFSSVKIKFKVEKSWITNNSLDSNRVNLYRLTGNTWQKLSTNVLSSDASYMYYEAESPGLSLFAIAGEKTGAPTQSPTIPTASTTPPPSTPIGERVKEFISGKQSYLLIIGFVVVIGIIALVMFILKKSPKKLPYAVS